MRVKKIAVRSWLNRNGVLNLELFNFAPDKNQPLANRWAAAHYCAAVRVYSEYCLRFHFISRGIVRLCVFAKSDLETPIFSFISVSYPNFCVCQYHIIIFIIIFSFC